MNWLKKIYDWILKWANTKWGARALFICAFADASFLPLPTLTFFLALTFLNITKAYKFALFGTLGILFGSIAGYSIGHFVWLNSYGEFTKFALFLFNHVPGISEAGYNKIQILYVKWDFWILFIASSLPLPYKIFSITSGVFDINVFIFFLATLVSQGLKFFLLAFFTIKLGTKVKRLLDYNWKPIAFITTSCVAIAIIVYKAFNF